MANQKEFPKMHVSLYVSDLAKSVQFYTAFFGVVPNKVKSGYAKFILNEPALIISFVENPEKVQANFGHLGFQVASKEEMEDRLESAKLLGLNTKEEIGTSCCYAVQDKFWVADPDGTQWEVYYFHADAEFNDPHYTTEEASACCTPPAMEEKPKTQFKTIEVKTDNNSCAPGGGCC